MAEDEAVALTAVVVVEVVVERSDGRVEREVLARLDLVN